MSVPAGSGPKGRGHAHWSSFGERLDVAQSAQRWFSPLLACVGVLGAKGIWAFDPPPPCWLWRGNPGPQTRPYILSPQSAWPEYTGATLRSPESLQAAFSMSRSSVAGTMAGNVEAAGVLGSACSGGSCPVFPSVASHCVAVPAWPCSWLLGHCLYLSICVPGGLFLALNVR